MHPFFGYIIQTMIKNKTQSVTLKLSLYIHVQLMCNLQHHYLPIIPGSTEYNKQFLD